MKRLLKTKLLLSVFVFTFLVAVIFSVNAFAATVENSSVTVIGGKISLENTLTRISISSNGTIDELYVKTEGESYLASNSYFTSLVNQDGERIYPSSVVYTVSATNTAKADVTYSDEFELTFDIAVYDTFITVQLANGESVPESSYKTIEIFPVSLSNSYAANNNAMAYSYPLNINTRISSYPGARSTTLTPTAYTHLDTEKAGVAFFITSKNNFETVMKDICNNIIDGDLMIKNSYGGPNYDVNPDSYGNYVILQAASANSVEGWKEFYGAHNIDQINFHHGNNTFRSGDFYFKNFGSAANFKETVSDPLYESGIISCLHTYAFFISPNATGLLSDPVKQQQFAFADNDYTLDNPQGLINANTKTVYLNEPIDMTAKTSSKYLLIGDEIVRIDSVNGNQLTTTRGMFGTTAKVHLNGENIRHFKSLFSLFAPALGTDLFYEVAQNTARAYIDGGFKAIYIDALDAIGNIGSDSWYYAAAFVHEIFKVLDEEGVEHPILEYSTTNPTIWFGRSRGGALDHGRRAFKDFTLSHITSNESNENTQFYSSQLGWYSLYPSADSSDYYGGFQVKYHFTDDTDYLGTAMIAYNDGVSFNGLTESNINAYPAYERNLEILDVYMRLKKEDYFSESIKQYLRESEFEFQIKELENNEYAFFEKFYSHFKNNDLSLNTSYSSYNPFDDQVPFIRIENLYSSEASEDESYKVFDFDPEAEFSTQYDRASLLNGEDLSNHLAVKTRVYGNGKGGAILIRLSTGSGSAQAYIDRVIPIDFEGWRDIVLVEVENGLYDHLYTFRRISDNQVLSKNLYAYYRNSASMSNGVGASIYTAGDMSGVYLDDIYLAPHAPTEIVNPAITVNGRTITFNTTLGYTNPSSSMTAAKYIEYDPETDTAKLYDYYGNATDVTVTVSDAENGFLVEGGDYTLSMSASSYTVDPCRLLVTLGFTGDEVLDGMRLGIEESSNGIVEADRYGGIQPGDIVTLNVMPSDGYKLAAGGLKITYTIDGVTYEKTIFDNEDGVFEFEMPDAYTSISATFVKEDTINIVMIGAGIRIPSEDVKQGLRFLTRVYTDRDDIEIIESGTLIIPQYVLYGRELTIDTSDTLKIVKEANKYYSYTENYFEYTGVLTDIPYDKYDAEIVARGYIKYKVIGETEERIAYTNVLTRSVLGIAQQVVADENVSESVKAAMQAIIDSFEETGDNDGLWPDGWDEYI